MDRPGAVQKGLHTAAVLNVWTRSSAEFSPIDTL